MPVGTASTTRRDVSPVRRRSRRRLAVQHQHDHPERPAVQRDLPRCRARTATPGRTGPNLIGDPTGRRPAISGSTRRRSAIRQRVRPAGERHVRRPGAERAAWTRLLAHRRVAIQALRHHRRRRILEVRIEAVNIFNNVNLGIPDSRGRRPGNAEHERGSYHLNRVRQRRPAAQFPVRSEIRVLARNHMPRVTTSP